MPNPNLAAQDNIVVRVISDSEEDQRLWQEYILAHPNSTIYHSLGWKRIFEKSFGYRSWYLLAQTVTDNRIVGCLPLFLVTSPLSRRLVSVPFRDRGGILWDSPESFTTLITKGKDIAREMKAAFLELKSLNQYPADLVYLHSLQERYYWIRSYIDLRPLDIDTFFQKLGSKTRNMIRQATKSSLTFEEPENVNDGVNLWYSLYLETQKTLGLPPFPLVFFRNMAAELYPTNELKFFLVRRGHDYLAATIILLQQKVAIYGYSASRKDSQGFRPNDFMLFSVIKWLMARGFTEFDLGSDSPQQKSLLFFKKKWLTRQEAIPIYTWGKADYGLSDSSDRRYDMIREIFSYLPPNILGLVGARIAKYFG
ncbi:MAG TPA: hypothetical protein DDZ80_22930 [Cyanobacteria bacterium UBA8803]|nr:hypothetical protein [Cyanobacteria bacterium UBA9273]HBL61182.1 hypothetical protein [Cyanobacteria bacterium UBA8803]